jgi:hypothetical protein
MWITENEVRTIVVIYLLLLIAAILVAIYSKHFSFKEKILRIILIVFIPIIGVGISLIEGFINFIKSKLSRKIVTE